MTDWKLIAAARNLGIPETEMEKIVPVMDALEGGFRPLVATIPLAVEPAVIFNCPPGGDGAMTILEAARALRAKKISSAELVSAALERIAALQPSHFRDW